jgi:hypothetical protein
MKKIITGIAALAMLTSVFAVDISARLVEKGSIAGGYGSDAYIFGMGKTHQKDADLLEFSFAGDKSGASFRLWADLGQDEPVKWRYGSFWFKPVDMLKVTIGSTAPSLYGERIDWWKVGTGVKYTDFNGWGGPGRYSGAAIGEGYGVAIELAPINGLTITAQLIPGVGNAFMNINEGVSYTAWGAMAKYQILENISAGVAFRDNGKDSWKQARFGVEFGNWGTPYYGFVQPVFLFNNKAADSGLDGICIDNYFSYNFGFMNLQARFPVTIRLTGDADDPSWMAYNIKASFPLDGGFTPYVQIQSLDMDDDGTFHNCGPMHKALTFDDNFAFNTSVRAGVAFSVGTVGLDVAACVNIDTAEGAKLGWYIPFQAPISF